MSTTVGPGRYGIDIPSSWEQAASQIQHHGWRKILILGATDRGKSTFCRYLSQELSRVGDTVAWIDADVGQKEFGPPATITLGYPTTGQAPELISSAGWYFVGSTSPQGHFASVIVGTQQLIAAAQAQRVMINTTGFVHGPGRRLKWHKIEAIQPDVIVAIAQGGELNAILQPHRDIRTLQLKPSHHAQRKRPEQRRQHRQRAFATYFDPAQAVALNRRRVSLQRTRLFTGKPVRDDNALYAERTADGLLVMAKPGAPARSDAVIIPADFARNLLCGVLNRRRRCVGLAILQHVDFDTGTLRVVTPVAPDDIRSLQLGNLYVTREGQEVGRRASDAF